MLHQYMEDELCNNKSLGALIYLFEKGREFEFSYKEVSCFISRTETQKEVSLWIDKKEYPFESVDALTETKVFGDKCLLDIWSDIEVEYLF